jgi:hypothetical protein
MKDLIKTNQRLIEEISVLKQKIKQLELTEKELRCTEGSLRRSEIKFRTLYDSTSDAVILSDEKGGMRKTVHTS